MAHRNDNDWREDALSRNGGRRRERPSDDSEPARTKVRRTASDDELSKKHRLQ